MTKNKNSRMQLRCLDESSSFFGAFFSVLRAIVIAFSFPQFRRRPRRGLAEFP